MDKNKRIITVLMILTIVFTIMGGTLAYWSWRTTDAQKTNITFTITSDFSCSADGGGDITSGSINLVPTVVSSTTTGNYIKREVKVTPTINTTGKTVYMDLWLDVKKLDSGLSNSVNFKYSFTTSSTSNTEGVVSSGNFNSKVKDDKINLLSSKSYSENTTDTYYLWIWLDAEETDTATMNQSFELSLNGSCNDTQPANAPVLDDGMIPVVISNNGVVTTVSSDNNSWYNYNNKEWANMVLVKKIGSDVSEQSMDPSLNERSREYYKNNPGVIVEENDILAYYVWIPRYSYRIPAVSCSTISNPTYDEYQSCYSYVLSDNDKTSLINWWQSSVSTNVNSDYTIQQSTNDINKALITGVMTLGEESAPITRVFNMYNSDNDPDITYTTTFNSSNNLTGPREIGIMFEDKTADKQNGDAIDTYHTHPAFTFGDTELSGIWVGKFETTGTRDEPTIKGNNAPLVRQKVSEQFATAQLFGTTSYGNTSIVDSHMMKSSEWGAVAYLSHSKYGINGEIRENNYYDYNYVKYLTGCGASATDESNSNICGITYGYATEYPQSTTGNITGIYDMVGGVGEYVMGVFANSDGQLWSGYDTSSNSGFTGLVGASGDLYTGTEFPDSKYYNVYKANGKLTDQVDYLTSCNGEICYGHGLSETANWYDGYLDYISATSPWLVRGGSSSSSVINKVNTIFFSNSGSGGVVNSSNNGFRSVMVNVG